MYAKFFKRPIDFCLSLIALINILKGDMAIVGERGIIETTKKNIDFSRVVAVSSIS